MGKCRGYTGRGLRCKNNALVGEVYCATHINKRRELSGKKCRFLRQYRRNPVTEYPRRLKPSGQAYGQIYSACRQRLKEVYEQKRGAKGSEWTRLLKILREQWPRSREAARRVDSRFRRRGSD